MSSQVVIVTGGGRGIGSAVCRRFASAGAQVVAASRTLADLEATRDQLAREGYRCDIRPTDVTSADEIDLLIEYTVAHLGRIDVLVNCAGIAPKAEIDKLDPSLFDTILAVNVRAVYLGCRAVWPVMARQGGGVIVNLSSIASTDPFRGFSAYGASKAWVNLWTRSLAEEGRACGIRVYAVAPGAVETRMLRDAFPDFPTDRALLPEQVAQLVHAVTEPAFHYATGQTIFIRK